MAETIGVDIGTQILNAVQGLAVRMDRLEARMDGLEARMGRLETRMDGLEARMDGLEARVGRLEARMEGLEAQVTDLKTQVTSLDFRMKRQERLMESLGPEFIKWREALRADIHQLRTDMHEGFRRLNARLDLTDGTVVLLAAALRRPRDLGEDLEKRLRALETH